MIDLPAPLVTPRLRVRPFRADDLDAMAAVQSDPSLLDHIPWRVRTREETAQWLAQRVAEGPLLRDDDTTAWALARRDDDVCLGALSVMLRSVAHSRAEMGFVLRADAHGQGYGTEAVVALLDHLLARVHRVYGRADSRNDASCRLMARAGMTREGVLRHDELVDGVWTDTVVYAVLADEWPAVRPTG